MFKKICYLLGLVLLGYFIFLIFQDYYYESHIKSVDDITYVKRENYPRKKDFGKNYIHATHPYTFLIQNGGAIDAEPSTCEITIERFSKYKASTLVFMKYKFSSKDDYMYAVKYIKRKGVKWILNHQFDIESDAKNLPRPKIEMKQNVKRFKNIYTQEYYNMYKMTFK